MNTRLEHRQRTLFITNENVFNFYKIENMINKPLYKGITLYKETVPCIREK